MKITSTFLFYAFVRTFQHFGNACVRRTSQFGTLIIPPLLACALVFSSQSKIAGSVLLAGISPC